MYVTGLLLFVSLCVLFPIIPMRVTSRLNIPISRAKTVCLLLALKVFTVNPFRTCLMSTCGQGCIYTFSFTAVMTTAIKCNFIGSVARLLLLYFMRNVTFNVTAATNVALTVSVAGAGLHDSKGVTFS